MKKVWDRLGIAFSSACIVHCILVVILPLFFPAIAHYVEEGWVHLAVIGAILFTSPLAFIPGFKKHGLTWIIGLASLGLFFILMGIILETRFVEEIGHGVSILGSILLVLAHVKNIQHSHRHQHQCC